MTAVEARALLAGITYLPGWNLVSWVELDDELVNERLFMRWVFDDGLQVCRTWVLNLATATKSDIVQTALRAALDAAEHEAREQFRFRGRKLYGPHFDPDALAEFSRRRANLSLPDGAPE